MQNEILEELWKVKDEMAKKNEYNLDKLAYLLKEKEKTEKRKIVDFAKAQKATLLKS